MQGNLGYLFYKDYFRKNNEIKIKKRKDRENDFTLDFDAKNKNKRILNYQMDIDGINIDKHESENVIAKDYFCLKVDYPGLLVGSGVMHEVGNEDEIKIGLNFDYTTGLPVINGSSVKGLLRNAFNYKEYIKTIIDSEENIKTESCNIDIDRLREEIFSGFSYYNEKKIRQRAYDRDIFFDAILNITENKSKKILSEDYITPHYKDEFKNPIPIKFIKIKSNTVMKFRFNLKNGILKTSEKLLMFRRILLDLGIGAKTNLGYGNFVETYGKAKLIELIENKKEKEIDKLSRVEKTIYFVDKEYSNEKRHDKLIDAFNELDELEEEERLKLARYIKDEWIKIGKWDTKKRKKQKKQYDKVQKIKQILDEE
ncbi:type III-B CRISPR module RAMP protein Cmr6 [Clostridiisalibacter paucivorans]|uniref:type III-B CRISPR module RAMP protein Cmr6 n=1 Tax=Clostridiisalibacter paucivorans TaxID=408753 RepID=UPI000688E655|nr:type III-B CRISPR module RAMP protein Cmr6 [Clostridiisalibacter paucivorans]